MKKLFLLIKALVFLIIPITASAYDFEVDGIYYNVVSQENLTCEVTKGDNKYADYIVISTTVTYSESTYSVTSIGEGAFYRCTSLTSVEIPNSVTSIGEWAFSGCESLTSVEIPDSVTSIGNAAFAGCTRLTSVEIPNSVTTIEPHMFADCTSLISVEIPNSVTGIGDGAFLGCRSLKEIISLNPVPPSLENIVFYGVDKNNCVLKVPNEAVDAYGWKDFYNIEGIDETSGIESITSDSVTNECGRVFNLQGQPVGKKAKGIIIIDGKKILVK